MIQLERLAQAFPWDEVQIQITRKPEGATRFLVWISSDEARGVDSVCVSADNPGEAVGRAIAEQKDNRDPELSRKRAIARLQAQLEKLKALRFEIPPYRPNRELCEHNPELAAYKPQRHQTIEV